jgi:hypothetical protein
MKRRASLIRPPSNMEEITKELEKEQEKKENTEKEKSASSGVNKGGDNDSIPENVEKEEK